MIRSIPVLFFPGEINASKARTREGLTPSGIKARPRYIFIVYSCTFDHSKLLASKLLATTIAFLQLIAFAITTHHHAQSIASKMAPKKSTSSKKAAAATKSTAATTAKVTKKAPAKTAAKETKATTATKAKADAAPKTKATKATKTNAAKAAPKKTTTTAAKATTTKSAPVKQQSKKRTRDEDESDTEENRPVKKTRSAAPKIPAPVISEAPTQKLNVFVFGEGSNGELGLGHMNEENKKVIDVKRPRLNPNLLPKEVGVVQLSAGGMHAVALTHDNKILTWGVNDQGALGRSTKSGEQFREINVADDDEDLNSGLNPLESAPAEVDYIDIPEQTIFTKVAAGDSITMVLTNTGLVYGCGTFRGNEGILGFTKDIQVQETLTLVHGLKNIVDITCGANHVIALDTKGTAYAFGSGQQNQLGRRIVERTKINALTPREFGLPRGKIQSVSAGAYHSFAIDKSGQVWTWGLNSFGETGIPDDAGEDGATVLKPQVVPALQGKGVSQIDGGAHHSLAVTSNGTVLAWGRCDGAQTGIYLDDIPEENFYHDLKGKVVKRLLLVPTPVSEVKGGNFVCAASDHGYALTKAGKAYSWGFSENYQTGQGTTEDIEDASLIDNTSSRELFLIWACDGGQYGMVASVAKE